MSNSPRAFYQVLRLHQLVSSCLDEALTPASLTGAQYTMLSLVRRRGPTTSAQLARWLRVSAQSAGEMLKYLELRQLVQRSESDTNRRIVLMSLTASGRRLAERADALVSAAETQFFAVLSDRERAGFDSMVQRLRQAGEPHEQPTERTDATAPATRPAAAPTGRQRNGTRATKPAAKPLARPRARTSPP